MMKYLLPVLLATVCSAQIRLQTQGRELRLNGEKVFVSGLNLAGSRDGPAAWGELEDHVTAVAKAGGNALRFWLHVDADDDAFIDNLKRLALTARDHNVLLFPVLLDAPRLGDLALNEAELAEYTEGKLRPAVRALKSHQAVGAWEVVSEPEAVLQLVSGDATADPCLDTTQLSAPVRNMQRAVGAVSAAVKAEDAGALVTVTTATAQYFSDRCMAAAGGGQLDVLTTPWGGAGSPVHNAWFKLQRVEAADEKPLLVGDFSPECSEPTAVWPLVGQASGLWACSVDGLKEAGAQIETAGGKVKFVLAANGKTRKSWYKRPKLLHNPDEMLEQYEKEEREKEEKEKAKKEKAKKEKAKKGK